MVFLAGVVWCVVLLLTYSRDPADSPRTLKPPKPHRNVAALGTHIYVPAICSARNVIETVSLVESCGDDVFVIILH